MLWKRYQCTYGEPPPSARCGHCVVKVKSSVWDGTLVVFHGGTNDRQFLGDLVVLHLENGLWTRPQTTGGPSPRAFHCGAVIGTSVYYFGGRTGARVHNEVWKLDTNLWEWTCLNLIGAKPDAREKADCIGLDESRVLVFGGYDGIRWLNDVFVINVVTLESTQVRVGGTLPSPRAGHKLAMLHQGILMFGGETTNTQYLGDLWALKGLFRDSSAGGTPESQQDNSPRWVKMQLSGPSPAGRSGHGFVNAGAKMIVYGGRGDEGWLSRKAIYHKDVAVIDRESVRWVKVPSMGEEPSERAHHSLTLVDKNKLLLFGGYNGKSTYGDMWFLEGSDDELLPSATGADEMTTAASSVQNLTSAITSKIFARQTPKADREDANPGWMQMNSSAEQTSILGCLRQRMGLPRNPAAGTPHRQEEESRLKEAQLQILKIAMKVDPSLPRELGKEAALARARSFFTTVEPENLTPEDVQALLYDYKCILPKLLARARQQGKDISSITKWNHVEYGDIKISEIPDLCEVYKELVVAL
ncbi:galactose oxidase [Chloropicon primus]|uniref:Galactose oxidase n=2 Tax=Chloropicon primus TaxID=1764295 RepID=A0A5B8MB73_9CHLO|nr:galactose oxidase [Chloropicon primus]UPQ96823.1 galactose oxidase [Chloropicon primus]|eukprot:QDZ17607.1 galactose oxidase [Chloropicon primus]